MSVVIGGAIMLPQEFQKGLSQELKEYEKAEDGQRTTNLDVIPEGHVIENNPTLRVHVPAGENEPGNRAMIENVIGLYIPNVLGCSHALHNIIDVTSVPTSRRQRLRSP